MSPLSNSCITLLDPPNGPYKRPTYSHIASISSPARLIYTAGQVGTLPDGTMVQEFEAQAKQAFINLKVALEAAGASVRDIVKLTYYIVDLEANIDAFRMVYVDFLTDEEGIHKAPSTLLSVARLARRDWLVEVEAVAAVRDLESKL
ncbi:putative endoribonuclease L-PSP [Rhexocercosporidium sp. MPI-PUGE-AT-0058]|nr:putative endoribonuclease L-PSP [Rhexocercosporidium sp. MPI-PUGE-AT-0058]